MTLALFNVNLFLNDQPEVKILDSTMCHSMEESVCNVIKKAFEMHSSLSDRSKHIAEYFDWRCYQYSCVIYKGNSWNFSASLRVASNHRIFCRYGDYVILLWAQQYNSENSDSSCNIA